MKNFSVWLGLWAVFALVLASCAPATTAAIPNTGATATSMPAATSAPAAAPILMSASNPTLGNILTDSKGMTLYIFTKDTSDTSNCYDKCAVSWPPLLVQTGASLNAASGISANLGTTQRKDGTLQLTVNHTPVYYWFKDKAAGDVNGQGVGSVWFVLDTSGNIVKTLLPTTPAAPTTAPTTAAQAGLLMVSKNDVLGNILTDSKGMTLYILTKDTPGTSNCYDKCAQNWPPHVVQSGANLNAGAGINAKLGTTQRKDGTLQLTVNDMPVYYFFKDKAAGDVSGQGVGSVWFVLDASGGIVKTSIPTTPSAPAPAATTAAQGALLMVSKSSALGNILTDSKGMTLYIFLNDTPGTSNCYDQCAAIWPPYTVPQGASLTSNSGVTAKLGTTQRKDGSLQLTVNGMPVYYWAKDKNPGDTTGQGIGSVWFVLDPSGTINKTELPAPAATQAPSASYNSYYRP